MDPSGLALAHQIVDLKNRLISHQRVLGKVKLLLSLQGENTADKVTIALEALEAVEVTIDQKGQPLGRLPGEPIR